MKIKYEDTNFRDDTLEVIYQAEEILSDPEFEDYTLTLRQLYYQFVGQDLIENSQRSYNRLGNIISKARMAGLISWFDIEDRGRSCRTYYFQEDEREALYGVEQHVSIDYWSRQEYYVEAWVEKDALISVLNKACDPYLVPAMACKGYLSSSAAWRAGRRFKRKAEEGYKCVLLHLGDHDPSGIDMTRDNSERLRLFSDYSYIDVRRLALNIDQVHEYNPPPNPAKLSDSRAEDYIKEHGYSSWELDALKPSVIENIVTSEIEGLIDHDAWEQVTEEQNEKRKYLKKLYTNWEDVKYFLEDLDE